MGSLREKCIGVERFLFRDFGFAPVVCLYECVTN